MSLMYRPTAAQQMKVVVGVKRVVDYSVKIRVKDNKVQTDNVKMSVNPFCEIALEEAVRLKEKKIATEVIAVTVGVKKADDVLRTAMALGCDKAIHIVVPDAEAATLEPLAVAKVLAKLHEELKPDLWILGKQAVDGDFGSTPQLLAGLIDAPQGTFASEIAVADGKVKVTREIDAGRQVVELNLPAVVAADLRLNQPRFPNLQSIMKARKKPVDTRPIDKLGVDTKPHLATVKVEEPAARKAGIKVKTVEELFDKLRNEAKVL
eukprot:CAMPEP_0176458132 /NCGR_PEP_ID=MMETSP0127-20121128/32401_1 /TAXON_ID=938130 /ORGANISM="Platyophrya macrostoma, Strain WH" /LENGTH=263 /DNA_ID=CAMNT_0017848623 /DNA_START=89 /DNA_END=880 /DNA_ORIENTATION=+